MPEPRSPNDPSWRNWPATWSKPSTWIIGTIVALVIIFGAAFLFGDGTGTDTAQTPTKTSPPAGAQTGAPPAASPPATTGAGGGSR